MQNSHNLELAWLQDCLALAEKRHFSQAAAARYVTQSAFSRRIQALEAWVGTPLFARNRRHVALTAAGDYFCRHAPEVIQAVGKLRDEALAIADNKPPHVVIAATHALSFSFFPELLRRNHQLAQAGAFRLLSDTYHACERSLLQGEAQFLLCHYHAGMHSRLTESRFAHLCLGRERLIPYSKTAAGRPQWRIGGAEKIPYLSFSNESGIGRIIADSAAFRRVEPHLVRVFTADLAATLLAMVNGGEGVAWLPQSLAQQDVANGRIAPAGDDPSLWLPLDIRLYRAQTELPAAVEQLWQSFAAQQAGVF
ncbi:LysR family transcriptional regulator [Chelonobacter oris]|uniref:LysR family transcriptional regulator n=1 Tax=Chelonobacter oris TaxID=505317 RepID=UPI00244A9671|nr:LysR family transcriptional regulator [Chelonobacter oris]MDH3000965.1 LysR family transcriptional regulator [Chelonobacter oris]